LRTSDDSAAKQERKQEKEGKEKQRKSLIGRRTHENVAARREDT
jgi:hypothetical protein